MEFKGTKGKWTVDSKNNVVDYLGDEIAICPEWRTTSKANALLISKSPEMLETLKECMRVLQSVQSPATPSLFLYNEIEQLIKEATEI